MYELFEHTADLGLRVQANSLEELFVDAARFFFEVRFALTNANRSSLPPGLRATALVLLEDEVRPDAHETLTFFAAQGVTLKVIA